MSAGEAPTFRVHDLLRLRAVDVPLSVWARESLRDSPLAVVRRAAAPEGKIPVGIRGRSRLEREAAIIDESAVEQCVTPEALVAKRQWRCSARLGAFAVAEALERLVEEMPVGVSWGPVGSVGFELAGGFSCVHEESDLDLAIRADLALDFAVLLEIHRLLARIPVRSDALLETPLGGFLLAELVGGANPVVMRTAEGPRLVRPIR